MILVYNEEARIRPVLEQACRWADEIIIVDKCSTDRTQEICREYERVNIIEIPYSAKGHDDMVAMVEFASNDWIFFGTASEIPTFRLIKQIQEVLAERGGKLDLIYVPRRMYSFGIHSIRSPWSVSYYPFLVNRKKTIITNKIHDNFRPCNSKFTFKIPYTEDCCVYHFTHPTAKQYLTDMMQYFEAEVIGCEDPEFKLRECCRHIAKYEKRLRNISDELFGHYCAWLIYWLGTALYLWENQRSMDVLEYYSRMRNDLLEREWMSRVSTENLSALQYNANILTRCLMYLKQVIHRIYSVIGRSLFL